VRARHDPAATIPIVEYEAVFRAAPDGIVLADAEGTIRDLNPAALRMFGYEPDELIGERIEVLVPERLRAVHRREREAFVERPHARPMGIGMELSGRRKDGSEFPVEISLSPIQTDETSHVIAIVHDVTERKRLRAFGAGALRAAEEERQRIARELHDDTAQRLAALLVRFQLATRTGEAADRERMLQEIREGIEAAADSVRQIARNLRPPVLDEVGVVGAIRAHVRTLREAYDVEAEVDAPRREPRLAADVELALYRIVQEALANVVRHAGARRARVTFAVADGALEVSVTDDGLGFDLGAVEREARGLGLLGMRERARNAGGELAIESAPGAGTRVRIRLPVEGRDG
jgi:PAS domain S-box-containing protein